MSLCDFQAPLGNGEANDIRWALALCSERILVLGKKDLGAVGFRFAYHIV